MNKVAFGVVTNAANDNLGILAGLSELNVRLAPVEGDVINDRGHKMIEFLNGTDGDLFDFLNELGLDCGPKVRGSVQARARRAFLA